MKEREKKARRLKKVIDVVGAKQIFFVKTNKILLAQQVATAPEGLSQTMWTQYEYFIPFLVHGLFYLEASLRSTYI